MSVASSIPLASDIKTIREKYDLSNPVVADIIRAKEERLKILQKLNNELEVNYPTAGLQIGTPKNKESDENSVKKTRKKRIEKNFPLIAIRKSLRLQNTPTVSYVNDFESPSQKQSLIKNKAAPTVPVVRPPNDYGSIPGVEVGFHWETRMECSMYGVHRPTVAGIHGGPSGAYSIALSGGYPEDVDEGNSFIYTGAGGRELKGTSAKPKNLRTAPQTKDQQLEGTNLSLVKSIESKLPVRVIRGYKSPSVFAPDSGYRYDGLYQVVEYWEDVGATGYKVYRFRMERMKDQAPAPWEKGWDPIKPKETNVDEEYIDFDETDDFKENIEPNLGLFNGDRVDYTNKPEDVKFVDREIEKCINHFYQVHITKSSLPLSYNSEELEFLGWEEQ